MKPALFWLCGVICAITIGHGHGQEEEFCDRNILGREGSGVITHPNYPFDSKKNRNCVLYIYVPAMTYKRTICFTFHQFHLQYEQGCFGAQLRYDHGSQEYRYCGDGWWDSDMTQRMANVFAPEFCWPIEPNDEAFSLIFKTEQAGGDYRGFYAAFEIRDEPAPNALALVESPPVLAMNDSSDDNSTTTTTTTTTTSSSPLLPATEEVVTDCDFDPSTCPQYCYHGYVEDELGCETCACVVGDTAPCDASLYTCFNRNCIQKDLMCNGVNDCGDSSDEGYIYARCAGTQGLEACNFDEPEGDFNFCQFDSVNWQRGKYSYGPRYDHTTGIFNDMFFAYTTYPGIAPKAYLNSTEMPLEKTADHCLSFWYFMSAYVGTLSVYVTRMYSPTGHEPRVWYRVDDHGNQWRHGEIDIPAAAFPITELSFVGEKGEMQYNNIAIDDVSLLSGNCFGDDVSCTFELSDCGWHDDGGEFPWKRKYGPTDTPDTGPSADTSGEGYYSYAEASTNAAKTARLVSRGISRGSGQRCLKFWYHMYGRDVGSLTIKIIYFDGEEHDLWMRNGDHGDKWMEGQVSLTYFIFHGPFQFVFEAQIGHGVLSDVAIDDIVFKDGLCEVSPGPSTSTVAPPPATCPPSDFQCDIDRCIPSNWVCDGSRNCDDGTDEENCTGSVSVFVIAAITLALLVLVIIIIAAIIYWRKRGDMRWCRPRGRRHSHRRQDSFRYGGSISEFPMYSRSGRDGEPSPEEYYGAENVALDPVGVPPPPYSEASSNAAYDVAGHGAMGHIPGGGGNDVHVDPPRNPTSTLTISVTTYDNEPPPPYQIAIIATPPSYGSHSQASAAATPPGYSTLPGERPQGRKKKGGRREVDSPGDGSTAAAAAVAGAAAAPGTPASPRFQNPTYDHPPSGEDSRDRQGDPDVSLPHQSPPSMPPRSLMRPAVTPVSPRPSVYDYLPSRAPVPIRPPQEGAGARLSAPSSPVYDYPPPRGSNYPAELRLPRPKRTPPAIPPRSIDTSTMDPDPRPLRQGSRATSHSSLIGGGARGVAMEPMPVSRATSHSSLTGVGARGVAMEPMPVSRATSHSSLTGGGARGVAMDPMPVSRATSHSSLTGGGARGVAMDPMPVSRATSHSSLTGGGARGVAMDPMPVSRATSHSSLTGGGARGVAMDPMPVSRATSHSSLTGGGARGVAMNPMPVSRATSHSSLTVGNMRGIAMDPSGARRPSLTVDIPSMASPAPAGGAGVDAPGKKRKKSKRKRSKARKNANTDTASHQSPERHEYPAASRPEVRAASPGGGSTGNLCSNYESVV